MKIPRFSFDLSSRSASFSSDTRRGSPRVNASKSPTNRQLQALRLDDVAKFSPPVSPQKSSPRGSDSSNSPRRRSRKKSLSRALLSEVVTLEFESQFFRLVAVGSLPKALEGVAKRGLRVTGLHCPNPPTHTGPTTYLQVQAFFGRQPFGPSSFHVRDVRVSQQTTRGLGGKDAAHSLHFEELVVALNEAGKHSCFAGAFSPPVQGALSSAPSIQLLFQRSPAPGPPLSYQVVELACSVHNGFALIPHLSRTLSALGSQGHRLVGAVNPPSSRELQRTGATSTLLLIFEKPQAQARPMRFTSEVVKVQSATMNVSFGVNVKGQYAWVVEEKAGLGWDLAAIIDVPDRAAVGVTTLFLVFQAMKTSRSLDPRSALHRSVSAVGSGSQPAVPRLLRECSEPALVLRQPPSLLLEDFDGPNSEPGSDMPTPQFVYPQSPGRGAHLANAAADHRDDHDHALIAAREGEKRRPRQAFGRLCRCCWGTQ